MIEEVITLVATEVIFHQHLYIHVEMSLVPFFALLCLKASEKEPYKVCNMPIIWNRPNKKYMHTFTHIHAHTLQKIKDCWQ